MMNRLSLLEIFLLEMVVWIGLWLSNDYVATLLTLSIGAIVSAVLIIALISELIERTKVPRRYFWIMGLSILAPLLAAALYAWLFGGKLHFIEQPF
ncbi:MAG TPA: hypothetical protein PLO67_07525 [Saprospiraceae bacterium]|nr:hypothetical protein [Saprospiraceae bacterium]HPI06080.1 hypothetical protein [Saprospiraceae bacterium]